MMIAKEGISFSAIFGALAIGSGYLWYRLDSPPIGYVGILFLLVTCIVIYFFRDPFRRTPDGDGLVVSAADGKVISIKPVQDTRFPGAKAIQVSVFLSLFDVHINRIPFSGEVVSVQNNPGRFFPAFKEKASSENEQTEIEIVNGKNRVVCKQVAGLIARRIICRLKKGDKTVRGERFGLIKFGSRVDLIIPATTLIKITLGDRVKGGESIIGVIQNE